MGSHSHGHGMSADSGMNLDQAWGTDWRLRLIRALEAVGEPDLLSLLRRNPAKSFAEVAQLLGPEFVPAQLHILLREQAQTSEQREYLFRTGLVRTLRRVIPKGWRSSSDPEFETARAAAILVSIVHPDQRERVVDVMRKLRTSGPPVGWLPVDEADSIVDQACSIAPVGQHKRGNTSGT